MGEPRLTSPLVTVIREGFDPLEIQTTNRDMVNWDRTRIRHKWPSLQDAPFLWLTFVSWSAARRSGAIPPDVTYETWESQVLDVSTPDAETDDDQGRPFPQEVDPA